MQKKEMAGLMVIAAGCLWGVIGLFSRKLSAVGFDAVQITALRSLVTAVGLFLLLFCKDRKLCRIDWKDLWMFLGTGICSIAGFNIFYFVTISITTLSVAAILLYTAPFFVMVLSAVLFHEKITAQKVKGLVLALAGCICTTGIFSGSIHVTVLGILTGVASGFCYALYSIFGKFALKKYTSETVTLYTFLMASAAMLPLSHPADMFSLAVSDFSAGAGVYPSSFSALYQRAVPYGFGKSLCSCLCGASDGNPYGGSRFWRSAGWLWLAGCHLAFWRAGAAANAPETKKNWKNSQYFVRY